MTAVLFCAGAVAITVPYFIFAVADTLFHE